MSFLSIIYTTLIGPLELIFEIIFSLAKRLIGNPGGAIVFLSLSMNLLVLPLYKRSDQMQENARDIEHKLHSGITHIKKTFNGDEKMMILQTYYRQNNYSPLSALNGSVSLLLEIPFFIAAYQFLSHLEIIHGVPLGIIADLGSPDALLSFGSFTINVLPILMTLINIISSIIYLKNFPLKTKIQLYAMAIFFLIFLYNSPSGLVFYWTLNNLFSLVKTVVYKIQNPKKFLIALSTILGGSVLFYTLFLYQTPHIKRKLFIIIIGSILLIPILYSYLFTKLSFKFKPISFVNNTKIFIGGTIFLVALIGILIPSTLIAASPQEFIDISNFFHPNWYIVNSFCLAVGTFIIWFGIFYWLATPSVRAIFDCIIWLLCGIALINYLFFGTNLGIISSTLQFENDLFFTITELLLNVCVIIALIFLMYLLFVKYQKSLFGILLAGTIALCGMSTFNVYKITSSISSLDGVNLDFSDNTPHFSLSTTGQNVIVLMLDRAVSQFIPYIFNENPNLKEQFDGFTYYNNAISFGGFTNFGTPALFGGYEYTPVEMNKREDESLASKQNEALKIMPFLFNEYNYKVTIFDPPYANYQWIPDLSIYDEYPEIETYITEGYFDDSFSKIENNKRNFFCYSLMKSVPLLFQQTLYNNGNYNQADATTSQVIQGTSVANGLYTNFMNCYNVLMNLPGITNISFKNENTFLMMSNNITHEPMLLQTPDYIPSTKVDNTAYDNANAHRFILQNQSIIMNDSRQFSHYHANMAAVIQLGKWFEYMRTNNVYDNTKIILVSDHGTNLYLSEDLLLDMSDGETIDLNLYRPLLMVKDFNSSGFTVSTEFMTNADVPNLAFKDIIETPINPFTGNVISNNAKFKRQYITTSYDLDITKNNGNTFTPSAWLSVSDNIFDIDNWKLHPEITTLPSAD